VQTDVKHLFAVGECAATHGVYRPGGSALNAGQVGSMRASEYISRVYFKNSFMDDESFQALAQQHLASLSVPLAQKSNIEQVAVLAQEGMSQTGGAIRNEKALRAQLAFVEKALNTLSIQDKKELFSYYEVKDILLTQRFYLFAMIDYINHGHKSRGSALYTDPKGNKPHCFLPDDFSFSLEKDDAPNEIQLIQMKTGKPCAFWRPVHPIPSEEEFFENVWREFRKNGNVF
jgi:succinate dehydrogenase/fumarate reductase flavoprotein subunit